MKFFKWGEEMEDDSWHNDMSPSLALVLGRGQTPKMVKVFVSGADLRKHSGYPRFTCMAFNVSSGSSQFNEPRFDTDSEDEAVAFVRGFAAACGKAIGENYD